MSDKQGVGIAIVGCGQAGRIHARAYGAIATIASVRAFVDVDDRATARCASEYSRGAEAMRYSDLDEALAQPDIRIVDICAPPQLHCDLALRAIAAGKHVLMEKPMAQTLREADAMIEAATRSRVILGQVFQNRFNRVPRRIKEIVARGLLGPLVRVCVYGSTIHGYDTLLWMFGDPVRVAAEWSHEMPPFAGGTDWPSLQIQHRWSALVRFADGTVGCLLSGQPNNSLPQLFPFQDDSVVIDIVGERMSVVFTIWGQRVQFRVGPDANGVVDRRYLESVQEQFEAIAPSKHADELTGHSAVLSDFVNAVTMERQPMIGGQEGRRTVALMTAIYKSAREGKVVSMPIGATDESYGTPLCPIPD